MKFAGFDSRADAESLRGTLYVGGDQLRELAAGEYWEHEVVGATVVDREERKLGVVTRLVPGVAHDLLAVETPAGERLVPVVADIVAEIDARRRVVRVDPPGGLLDG